MGFQSRFRKVFWVGVMGWGLGVKGFRVPNANRGVEGFLG